MIKTVSLETAKLLRDAGFPHRSSFSWCVHAHTAGGDTSHIVWDGQGLTSCGTQYLKVYCPTTDELLEELPGIITLKGKGFGNSVETKCVLVMGKKVNGEWRISYRNQIAHVSREDESLPETLAQMWLWLKNKGLL